MDSSLTEFQIAIVKLFKVISPDMIDWARMETYCDGSTIYDFDSTVDVEAASSYTEDKAYTVKGTVMLSTGSWLQYERRAYPFDDEYEWNTYSIPTKPLDWE